MEISFGSNDLSRSMSSRGGSGEDDEEELRWAAIERLPTYDRIRKSVLKHVLEDGTVKTSEINVKKLGIDERGHLISTILDAVEVDNEKFLQSLRARVDRVGIELPTVEIRYENLAVEGDVHVGGRSLPTLINATLNSIESILGLIRLVPSKKKKIKILKDVSGIIRPSRITLLLGPPGAGKTTLMLALAGKLDHNLRKSGKITYCGHEFNEFVPQRTSAYISQHDLHPGKMTVRETLDFASRCLGVGSRYEMLEELSRREKQAGIKPADPGTDAYMKAISISGQKTSLITDYTLKILGLDICANIMVGDDMKRGISGGQKRRVTTGEMLVGPAKALLMDEISSGLDSSTTFQIVKHMRQIAHVMDITMLISLLQPPPETYDLFDDIILLTEGQIVYQGPRENVLDFFDHMGFKCPDRKGVADFLQEVTSKKDQEQYWHNRQHPYRYITPSEFARAFQSFHVGEKLVRELRTPYDKSKAHPAALVTDKYGISNWELFCACFSRELILMKRNSFIYTFQTMQIAVMSVLAFTVFFRTQMPHGQIADGAKYFGALFFSLVNVMFNGMSELVMTVNRLPVFYKQRDSLFYPAWVYALPVVILGIPTSVINSTIWVVFTYYTIGFAPGAGRFFRQLLALICTGEVALGFFRCIAGIARTLTATMTLGLFSLIVIFILGGFLVSKNDLDPWLKWAYYISPMSYGQNAIIINEFLDKRWSTPNTDLRFNQPTVGKVLLQSRGFYTEDYWYWICVVALIGFSLLFNTVFVAALTYLNPVVDSKSLPLDDDDNNKNKGRDIHGASDQGVDQQNNSDGIVEHTPKKGSFLPFQPLSLVFNHINYYVKITAEMKAKGVEGDRLQLLQDVSGAFRPGVLTALVGVSGAGKTTLMDVLAGRKTSGYIEGNISISGYPKNRDTFTRISGYCEQNDIHSPNVTVYESVLYSAWLRLPSDVKEDARKMFVEEVMELVELNPIRNSSVGLPGVSGLSTEQRKRLTIAVELVANPSIIFMDEPTSGLDARAAAIVMRTVRNTVDTGRTVVCTIHQPSIDIFEAFDELLLMKRGGKVVYAGQLGRRSHKLIEYFEAIPGVPNIEEGQNPATWVLDIITPSAERQLGVDFADIYANSSLYQSNQEVIQEASVPPPGSKDLKFPTQYSQPFLEQCKACFWKQYWSYWRNPRYNAIRFLMTIAIGLIFGLIFWDKGQKIKKQQDLSNLMGAMYSAIFFLGNTISGGAQTVVALERTVFYREKAAGMYSPLPYVFAQVAIETIYIAVQSIVYTLLLYSMIGFQWTAAKFLWFYYFIFTGLVYFSVYAMMFVALTQRLEVGSTVAAFFRSFWNLFSGFVIPRKMIPIWWRWYYWGSPVAWTVYGVVVSQFGDLDSEVEVPGLALMTVKEYLMQNYGFDYNFLHVVAFMPLVFIVLFAFIYAFAVKFLNFQRR